jgi:hypothetical protein
MTRTGAEVMQRIAVPRSAAWCHRLADADRHSGDLRGGERDCYPVAASGSGPRSRRDFRDQERAPLNFESTSSAAQAAASAS